MAGGTIAGDSEENINGKQYGNRVDEGVIAIRVRDQLLI